MAYSPADPEWMSIVRRARAARKRVLWQSRLRHGGRRRWPPRNEVFYGYRPSVHEYVVMFMLENGPLPSGASHVPGAHVATAPMLVAVRAGLATYDRKTRMAELTDEGRLRVERRW